jgi:hypothetical protein
MQTARLAAGTDTDHDGIADAWELSYTNSLAAFSDTSDTDGDGLSDLEEYLADTNPLDPDDQLQITDFSGEGSYNLLGWTSKPSRLYRVERRSALDGASSWEIHISYDWPGWNHVGFNNYGLQYFLAIGLGL